MLSSGATNGVLWDCVVAKLATGVAVSPLSPPESTSQPRRHGAGRRGRIGDIVPGM